MSCLTFVAHLRGKCSGLENSEFIDGISSMAASLFCQSFKNCIPFTTAILCFNHLNAFAQLRTDFVLPQPAPRLQGITIKGTLRPSGCNPEALAEVSRKRIVLNRIFFTSAGLGGLVASRRDNSFLRSGDSVLISRQSFRPGFPPVSESFPNQVVVSNALLTLSDQGNLSFEFPPNRTRPTFQDSLKPNIDGAAWISVAGIQRADSQVRESVNEAQGSGIQVLHLAYYVTLEDSTLQAPSDLGPSVSQFAFVPRRYIQVLPTDTTRDVGRIPVLCIANIGL
jgi:hypothetical protein